MVYFRFFIFLIFCSKAFSLSSHVTAGIDVLLEEESLQGALTGKRIGLLTNHTALNRSFQTTLDLLLEPHHPWSVTALFSPEHGFYGDAYSAASIDDQQLRDIPIYSLHGSHRRPTPESLQKIDLLIYDIQDIGSRSYTYISTLFYFMEEAAAHHIPIMILDRPNPLGGKLIDGALLEEKYRSFLGYINVPYCHGMTVAELANYFNAEYQIGCTLITVPMRGWKREMIFSDTGLTWVPTSPQVPEADTPFYYPTTGILGHLSFVSIGVGYTLPFKIVGAPWMESAPFASALNALRLPGVVFQPFHFRPFFGKFKAENCQGIRIIITDPSRYLPVSTQFAILGVIKNLYPRHFNEGLSTLIKSSAKKDSFNRINGDEEILQLLKEADYFIWPLRQKFAKDRALFLEKRKKYLIY